MTLVPMETAEANATEFKAGFFTLGDIIIFSYEDGLTVSIYNATGTLLTTQSMNTGEHYFFHNETGVYYAIGNKPYSILIGDPITRYVNGYFAANDSYYGVAEEFYTYTSLDHDVITFAYDSGITEVVVEEWSGSAWVALSTFTLTGPGDHHRVPKPTWSSKWLHFTSNQSISVQCYSDRTFFVPEESGLWSGTHFYSFAGWYGGGDNIHVHSYVDDNWVEVWYLGGSLIWNGTLNDGEWVNIDRGTIGTNQYIEVISTNTVTVSHETYFTSDYYGLVAVPDESGTGIGTIFYTYAREDPPGDVGSIWVFAYSDNTNVEIKDMDNGSYTLWTGTLNANDYHQFTPNGTGGHLFGIFSDNVVSVVEGSGGWGAEFVPLYFAFPRYDLHVVVEDASTTLPIPGATVNVAGPETRSDITNATGFAEFLNLLEGDYNVTAFAPGYMAAGAGITLAEDMTIIMELWPIPAATIESCDSGGVKKDVFDIPEDVYVIGSGYLPSTDYEIYIVEDTTWIDGMSIPSRVSGTVSLVTSGGFGSILTKVWSAPLIPGKYDIIVDVNNNTVYDAGVDTLDDMDVEFTAGFFVIPELPFGTILGLVTSLGALLIFRSKRINLLR